jgi:hypothetical protein
MVAKAPYLDSEGRPRFYLSQARCAFEGLARRFCRISLKEVVALACENSEVITRPGIAPW